MRVWILEKQPAYEPGERRGVYATVDQAVSIFHYEATNLVSRADEFAVDVAYEFTNPRGDLTISVVEQHSGDAVSLSGVLVDGASYASYSLEVSDEIWAQVTTLIQSFIRRQRVDGGFKAHEANRPATGPTGMWKFVRRSW